jgi:hypothetical protein
MSDVVLGFSSGLVELPCETSFFDTYFGGTPTFASQECAHEAPRCDKCDCTALFVLQAYNSSSDEFHLTMHLYACPRCTTWFAKRCVSDVVLVEPKVSTTASAAPAAPAAPKAAFSFDFDDEWGACKSSSSSEPAATATATATAATETKTAATFTSNTVATFRLGFIEVDYEPEEFEDDEGDDAIEQLALSASADDDGLASDDFVVEPEEYEESDPFQKFVMRLARAPEQLCRYGGKPLWPTRERPRNVPACGACGAARAFELQLLPTLLSFLEPSAARMVDFGSVFVYTCSAQCRARACTDEFCFVIEGQ